MHKLSGVGRALYTLAIRSYYNVMLSLNLLLLCAVVFCLRLHALWAMTGRVFRELVICVSSHDGCVLLHRPCFGSVVVYDLVLQLLAKELVMSRNAKNRMHEGKAQLHSVQMQLQNQIGEPWPHLFVYSG